MPRAVRQLVIAACLLAAWSSRSADAWITATNATSPPAWASGAPGTKSISTGVGCNSTTAYPTTDSSTNTSIPRFSYVIKEPIAEFISVNFKYFNLPSNDYVLIRATDENATETARYMYRGNDATENHFVSTALYTTSITIELFTSMDLSEPKTPSACVGFEISDFRYLAESASYPGGANEEVCGADESIEAACAKSYPTAFARSNAVMRLLIHKSDGSYFCTGWLVGEEGHMITNNHCISTQDHATNTEFEFQAQSDSCDVACNTPLGCRGALRTRSAQLIVTSSDLDYSLVKLDINYSKDYGYLQMRDGGAVKDERIYIPQHPAGWGKRISLKAGADWGTVTSVSRGGCLPQQVAYYLDTQGGSSGSPVIAWADNVVVALHHCGGCPNTAVNTKKIVADLRVKNLLPRKAVYDPSAVTPAPNPAPAPTTLVPTPAPTTLAPTPAPTTLAPTPAPTTLAPTPEPTTVEPTPATEAPTTTAPQTAAPTDVPATSTPVTSAPVTNAPVTVAPVTAAPTPRRKTVVDGTISTTAKVASIDYIDFKLASDAIVELDILSMERIADGEKSFKFVDLNGDCNAGYIDSSIVLFRVNDDGSVAESTIVSINDNAPAGYGAEDGSLSSSDSYIVRPLTAGNYRVAVGISSMTVFQAMAKTMPVAPSTPCVCSAAVSNYGSYRLTIATSSDVTVSGPNSYIGSQCSSSNSVKPYAQCPYHTEPALSKAVTVDGTISRQGETVSVDYIPFTMASFGRVTIDVSSYESVTGYTYVDVNGYCSSGYIDAVAFLFRRASPGAALTISDLLNTGDDDENFARRKNRHSISFRDPYLSLALPPSEYVVVIGRYPMTIQDAINKVNTGSPDKFTPESCGSMVDKGNYMVTFGSAVALSVVSPNTFSGTKCPQNMGKALCEAR